MSRDVDRKTKGELRWDFKGGGRWFDKSIEFTEEQQKKLLNICPKLEFLAAVKSVVEQYMARESPARPEANPEITRATHKTLIEEYRQEWLTPSAADMKKTLLGLKKIRDKVGFLRSISGTHPIWSSMRKAWLIEYRRSLENCGFSREKIIFLARKQLELNSTPKDHPFWERLQTDWERLHKLDYEKLNIELIPQLAEITLKHLSSVYMAMPSDSATEKRWLVWNLAKLFPRFGLNPSQSKGGKLCMCIEICLGAAGCPTESPHKYITTAMIQDAKGIHNNLVPPLGEDLRV